MQSMGVWRGRETGCEPTAIFNDFWVEADSPQSPQSSSGNNGSFGDVEKIFLCASQILGCFLQSAKTKFAI